MNYNYNMEEIDDFLDDEYNFDDEQSIYSRKIEDGLAKFREEHSDQPNTDIVRCVKRVIFGDKKGLEHENLEMLAIVFREIVNICNLTPQEYDNVWSVGTNKKMFLENISRKITALASDVDKEECAFQRKRLLFKIVYPEYYKEHFTKIEPKELIFVSGENKAVLSKAAKPLVNKEEKSDNTITSDGAIVDRLIMKALNEALKISGFDMNKVEDQIEIMKFLANEKQIRAMQNPNSSSSSKNQLPSCFEIIKTRQCYESFIDFYFLNLPKEEQVMLVDDYMEIRKNAEGIENNPLLDKFYEIFQENRDDFVDSLYI